MIIKSGGNLKLVLRWLTSYMKENIKPGGAAGIVPNLFCKRWWFEPTSHGSIQSDFQVIVGLQLVFEDNWLKYLQNKHIWRKTLNLVEKRWRTSHPRMSKHLKSSSVRCSLTVKCWTPLHSSLNLRSHFCFNKKCESYKILFVAGWLIVNMTWLLDIRLQRVRAFGSRFTAQIGVMTTYKISYAPLVQWIRACDYGS